MRTEDKIAQENRRFLLEKVKVHGTTVQALDWKSEKDQEIRFHQLGVLFKEGEAFSLNDLGCGFGDFSSFLQTKWGKGLDYCGYDNVPEMIELACQKYPTRLFKRISSPHEMRTADYTVASGIFNKTFSRVSEKDWWDFMTLTIRQMYDKSKLGIAFNALTSYSDKQFMREDLYYSDPCRMFDFCKRNLSRNVTLLHDYDLYDFTILIKKEAYFQ